MAGGPAEKQKQVLRLRLPRIRDANSGPQERSAQDDTVKRTSGQAEAMGAGGGDVSCFEAEARAKRNQASQAGAVQR